MCDIICTIYSEPTYLLHVQRLKKGHMWPPNVSKAYISEIKYIFDSKNLCPKKHAIHTLASAKTKEKKRKENVNHMLSTAYPLHKDSQGAAWASLGEIRGNTLERSFKPI